MAAAVLLGGCGDDGAAQPKATGVAAQLTDSRTELRACMREHGVQLADRDAVASLSKQELAKANALLENECKKPADAALDVVLGQSGDYVAASRAFFACLERRGLDIPDPTTPGAQSAIEKLDEDDPAVERAVQACSGELPAELRDGVTGR